MSDKIRKAGGMDRRHVLQAMAGVAGMAALGMPTVARAAGTIVVGTWGGDYARLLNKNIEKPFLISKGWEVIQDQKGDPERRAKMMAERRLPRGSTDLQALTGPNMYQVYQQGLTQALDYSKLPNAKHLLPSMKYEYGAGQIYSAMVPVFNPDKTKTPPKSYADALNPELGAALGFIDIQYQYTLLAAALAAGGSQTDLEPGKKLLLECRKAGARIYPTNESFAQGLKSEEITAGIMWKARTVQWQNAGINVASNAPAEGGLSYVTGFAIPKNARNVDGAHAYINAMMEPAAQEAFAHDMGYNPTVDNAEIPAELNKRIGFSKSEIDKLITPDFGFILEHDMEMKEWWDKEFKA
ncbi:putative spermidine/putrescine transport system substrate-binding protein [Breoghania corrubedonensis]|uniref:Putative spermidine/putrescine transport system substrate-binding protein n=1 Tax=Breoghania corrubedonensis TaxID=665038 RepID=A0A2T5VGN2_9HYPH|nr:extracellular solute-binding protein [Breoghania corrubedonensis]PTW62921.1 putative spermidine/putrescine transport system substrate-binding protein [Breoghania corrubedonensis]